MRTHEVDEAALIEELPKLHELQGIDLRIGELLEERAQIDDGAGKTSDLQRAEARLAEANARLSELRGRQVDRRLERDGLQERRERNQHRLWQEMPSHTRTMPSTRASASLAPSAEKATICREMPPASTTGVLPSSFATAT